MIISIHESHNTLSYRFFSAFIAFTFIFSLVLPPGYAQLIPQTLLNLPAPGTMVTPSAAFTPALINGITIHPENPLEFDFIVGTGDEKLQGKAFEDESTKLIKYFLASLTVPEDEMWVNLSPYEKDRIIPEGFGTTEMGRDLLAQDYILKQLTASLMYPEKELGSEFWKKIYQKAREQYGTTEIPVNTFNKVWIVPEKAVVYEHGNSAFVVKSRLRVMLEQDYLAASQGHKVTKSQDGDLVTGDVVTTGIIREVIIPEIEKEVNEGKGFANLRQIYHSAILAVWFKQNLRQTLLGQVYVDKTKTKGVDVDDKTVNEKIYAQYLEAFKKGVYNYIKEDYDPATQEMIPRKYFSGGANLTSLKTKDVLETYKKDQASSPLQKQIINAFLAGQSSEQQEVNIKLLELSQKRSAADVQRLIEESQQHVSKPAEVEKAKEDVLAGIKEAKRLLEKLSAEVDDGLVPSGINILKYTALLNALRAASLKEGGGKDASIPAASLLNITERKNLGSRIQGILATLNGNANTSEEDKKEITLALKSLQENLKKFKAFEDVIFQEASLDEQLKKVSHVFNRPEVNIFYALRNAVDKEKLADGLADILGETPEGDLRERMAAAGMIYSIGDKYILRPYFLISPRLKKIASGIPGGVRGQVETIILDSIDVSNFIAGLAWDSRKSEEEIVRFLEGQKRLSPLAGRWRSFYARESDEAALREAVKKSEDIAGEFIKSHPAKSGEFVLAARVAPGGKSAVVTTAIQSPSGNNERASRILLLDLSKGDAGVRVLHEANETQYNSPFNRIAFFDDGKAVAVWNLSRQIKWDISDPENPRPIGWQEEETWAQGTSSSPAAAVMKFLPEEIGRGVWGGNLFAWRFNSRLNRITGGNESDKFEIAKEMGDLIRILMRFEGRYHDFFEVLKTRDDKDMHFDREGLVEKHRTRILNLLRISDTTEQALRHISIAREIAKSIESQTAGEKIFQVPFSDNRLEVLNYHRVIVDVSLVIGRLVWIVEEIIYHKRPGKNFQVRVKDLAWTGRSESRYGRPRGKVRYVSLYSPTIDIVWSQSDQVIEEDVKDRSPQDNAGVKADILSPVLPIIPGEEIDRVVGMVKEYDALSETGERELRLFFAQKIKEISFKTFLEDKKDVPEDLARHIVVSAWLAAKYHLSALGMRGLFVYFEDGTKRNFYELGMMRADSGNRLSMQEAGEILAEGDILLSNGFVSASSPVAVGELWQKFKDRVWGKPADEKMDPAAQLADGMRKTYINNFAGLIEQAQQRAREGMRSRDGEPFWGDGLEGGFRVYFDPPTKTILMRGEKVLGQQFFITQDPDWAREESYQGRKLIGDGINVLFIGYDRARRSLYVVVRDDTGYRSEASHAAGGAFHAISESEFTSRRAKGEIPTDLEEIINLFPLRDQILQEIASSPVVAKTPADLRRTIESFTFYDTGAWQYKFVSETGKQEFDGWGREYLEKHLNNPDVMSFTQDMAEKVLRHLTQGSFELKNSLIALDKKLRDLTDATRKTRQENWKDGLSLNVRMGIDNAIVWSHSPENVLRFVARAVKDFKDPRKVTDERFRGELAEKIVPGLEVILETAKALFAAQLRQKGERGAEGATEKIDFLPANETERLLLEFIKELSENDATRMLEIIRQRAGEPVLDILSLENILRSKTAKGRLIELVRRKDPAAFYPYFIFLIEEAEKIAESKRQEEENRIELSPEEKIEISRKLMAGYWEGSASFDDFNAYLLKVIKERLINDPNEKLQRYGKFILDHIEDLAVDRDSGLGREPDRFFLAIIRDDKFSPDLDYSYGIRKFGNTRWATRNQPLHFVRYRQQFEGLHDEKRLRSDILPEGEAAMGSESVSSPVIVATGAAGDEGGKKRLRTFVEEALAEDPNYFLAEDLIRDLTNILVERKHDTPASLEALLSAINFIVTEYSDIVLFIPSDLEDAMDEVNDSYDSQYLETVKQLFEKIWEEAPNGNLPETLEQFTGIIEDYLRNSGTSSPMIGEGQGARVKEQGIANDEIRGMSDGFTKGGIDLNPALLDLQIKRDGNGVPLPLPQQPIETMHIEGFLPVIINITPVINLPLLLGLADTQQDTEETRPAMKAREPEEISALN